MQKVKDFFNKVFSAIAAFFQMIFGYIKKGFKWLGNTKVMKKIGFGLAYFPNKIASYLPYKQRQTVWGIIFILPLMVGFVYFFLMPFITTIIYSFSNVVRFNTTGYDGEYTGIITEFVGIDNYKFIFTEHAEFSDTLLSSFGDTFINVPVILIFSLIIAVVLNSQFRGRAFVRAVFFMPVIFNSQAIDVAMKSASTFSEALENANSDMFSNMFNFSDFLTNANMPTAAVTFLTDASSSIFDIITYSGVQILIFLSAIQSVPKHLYEAAKIEGATQYEIFWKITFPMVSPQMLTAAVYTVVDSYMRSEMLTIIQQYDAGGTGGTAFVAGLGNLTKDGIYSAMSMIFCLSSIVIIAIWMWLLSRMVFYYDE